VTIWLGLLVQRWRKVPRPRPLAAAFYPAGPAYLLLGIVLALLPALSKRIVTGQWQTPIQPDEASRFSLILLNLSVAAVWGASIFLPWEQARSIVAIAYLLVIAATLPYVWRMVRALRAMRGAQPAAAVQA
jgi:hypothetical protein